MNFYPRVEVKPMIPFDLKVGDKVTFLVDNYWHPNDNGHHSNGHSTMMREAVGEVVSIHKYTFTVKYTAGLATLKQSLVKTDYQIGEVRRYHEETE